MRESDIQVGKIQYPNAVVPVVLRDIHGARFKGEVSSGNENNLDLTGFSQEYDGGVKTITEEHIESVTFGRDYFLVNLKDGDKLVLHFDPRRVDAE